jgi:hypothetical protein
MWGVTQATKHPKELQLTFYSRTLLTSRVVFTMLKRELVYKGWAQ